MTKFTPGPWKAYAPFLPDGNWGIAAVANIGNFSVVHFSDPGSPAGIHGRTQKEREANARLIAKAPDMYAMLEDAAGTIESAVTMMQDDWRDMDGMREFAAAIRTLLSEINQ